MPLRSLVANGVEWTVWNVVPTLEARLGIPLTDGTGGGWLCFQSATEKRRVAPAPVGWEHWSDEELAACLGTASLVPQVQRPSRSDAPLELDDQTVALHSRAEATVRRAQDLGERVRRAMEEGGARPLNAVSPMDPTEPLGPDDAQ